MPEGKFSVRIAPGRRTRRDAPAEVHDDSLAKETGFLLEPGGLPAQVVGGNLCFIIGNLAAGEELTLEARETAGSSSGMSIDEKPGTLCFREGDQLVTEYLFSDACEYPFVSKPFFYPLNLGNLCLTRAVTPKALPQPDVDHPHHRSLWVGFGDVAGTELWNESEGHGFQRHLRFTETYRGPVCAGFTEELAWETGKGEKLLDETRSFRAWKSFPGGRFLDLRIVLRSPERDLRLGDTKEGGICALRVREPLQGDQGGIITGAHGGVSEAECWGQSANWMDYSGQLEGRSVGIAVFDHPLNFRYPTRWHVRDYGLFAANPFGHSHYRTSSLLDGSYTIETGGSIVFFQRIFLHKGGCNEARVAERWMDFGFPPAVEIVP